jgi:hypothetical protein
MWMQKDDDKRMCYDFQTLFATGATQSSEANPVGIVGSRTIRMACNFGQGWFKD